jgi:hypothetical protein
MSNYHQKQATEYFNSEALIKSLIKNFEESDIFKDTNILAYVVNSELLARLANGKMTSDILPGEYKGNFYYHNQYKIVAKSASPYLHQISNLPTRIKEEEYFFKELLNDAVQASKVLETVNEKMEKIGPCANHVIELECSTRNNNNYYPQQSPHSMPVKVDTYDQLQQSGNDLGLSITSTLKTGLRRRIDNICMNSVLLWDITINYRLGEVYLNIDDSCDCLNCPLFPRVATGQQVCSDNYCPSFLNLHKYLSQSYHGPTLLDIYAEAEGLSHQSAIDDLIIKLDIDVNSNAMVPSLADSKWIQSKSMTPFIFSSDSVYIEFKSELGAILGIAEFRLLENGKKAITSWSNWCRSDSQEQFLFPAAFQQVLLNSDLIYRNPDATVYLTDCPVLAYLITSHYNNPSEKIGSSWLGGKKTISKVRLRALKNSRKVVYVLIDYPGCDMSERVKVAAKAVSMLKENGIEVSVEKHHLAEFKLSTYQLPRDL